MAIVRMISRDPAEFRAFQSRMVEVGRIRIGQFVIPEGRKGRPVKLDRFRLTSPKEDHIQVAADLYGGVVRPYAPQGGGAQQWEVITDTGSLDVYIINGQLIDPVYEMWGAGRTCIRRCDGEWNTVLQEPCLCNGPDRPQDVRQLCKITTRVNVMLPRVAGLHAWRLETHSENAALEMGAPAVSGLVQVARVPVPSTLYLRHETRRERNHAKRTFESKDFYVPTFHIPLSALELAAGPEAVTAALTAAGAPMMLAAPEDRRAIEARQVSAIPAQSAPEPPVTSAANPGTVDVTISAEAIAYADEVAEARRTEARASGYERDGGEVRSDDKQWEDERVGIRAEAAVWKYLHPGTKPELHVNVFNGIPDVDPFDVKNIADPSRKLLHRPHERQDRPLLLTLGTIDSPTFRLLGWRWGWECRRSEWLGNPGGTREMWMVPQADLYPMSDRSWEQPPALAGDDPQDGSLLTAEEHRRILTAVEAKTTLDELDGIREAMVARGIRYKAVQDAWVSKRAAIVAADNLARDDERADQVAAAIAYGPEYFADDAEQYTEAVNRGATHEAIVEAGGPLHWLATDDQARGEADAWRPTEFDDPPPEHPVGTVLTVGGIEFTKISDNPFQPGSVAAQLFGQAEAVEGTVEGDGTGLPMLPAGTYEVEAELPRLMAVAGKFRPPLTTDQVRARVMTAFDLKHMGVATGEQFARVRTALEHELTG